MIGQHQRVTCRAIQEYRRNSVCHGHGEGVKRGVPTVIGPPGYFVHTGSEQITAQGAGILAEGEVSARNFHDERQRFAYIFIVPSATADVHAVLGAVEVIRFPG